MLRFLLFLLLFSGIQFLTYFSFAQQTDTTRDFTNYRRIDPNSLPSPEKFAQPKEQVFPLGYGTNHLGKVVSGTGIWTELNPGVPRVDYVGIDFINPDTGWACGGSGAIIKTINGGGDWTISETPINNLLLKTHSYNGQIVIATGYDGIILRSSDGGDTFEQVVSGVGNGIDLWGLQMVNDTIGWVCGMNQTLLKTTDAGLTWQPVNAGLNQHYWSLDFLDEQYGMIVCGGGIVLRTTDGGNSWAQIQAGDTRALYTIDMIDSLHIAVGGETGKNCYSSNGGLTWTQNSNLIFSEVNCIAFVDADTGYTVGELWGIKKTTNRGVSWFSEGNNICEWWLDLLPGGVGYSVGDGLKIYKTEGGYDNWVNLFFNINLADVYFTNEMTGYIAGGTWIGGPVYKTTDGGLSWFGLPNFPIGLFTSTLTTLIFTDSVTGFASGTNTTVKTTDAGKNWYEPNGLLGGLGDFSFINKTVGWATSGKRIMKTTDEGESWFEQILQTGADSYLCIFFVDSLNGWATSRYVWLTTDGGENWNERTDIPAFFGTDIYFIDSVGFIVELLKLFKSTDSGNSWIEQLSSQYILRSFGWLDTERGFIIGDGMYETTNSGETWQEILELRNIGLRKFYAPLNYIGYSVGNQGLIYKYIDSSYVPVELISFNGFYTKEEILLNWETASEINNSGFEIQKSRDKKIWKSIGFVTGNGSSTEHNRYNFTDNTVLYKKNYYRLKQIDYNGSYVYSNCIEVSVNLNNFQLYQNYPNPFNPFTIIKYTIPQRSFIKISLYDIKGERIVDLVNEEKETGIYTIEFNNKNLPSGVYVYRMTSSNGYFSSKKLIILK